ncbi:MAG: phosphoribosylformylglycinamidine synthase, partial [Leptotrichiaceae bacterium]
MNYRIYVEKKKIFNVESEELFNEIRNDMLITNIENVKVINIYDIFNIDGAVYLQTRDIVFSDKVSDIVYDKLESLECEGAQMFAVEYLPGQYDQRADSAKQCIDLLLENTDSNTNIEIRSGKLIVLYGKLTNQEIQKIKKYYINEVEMREKQLDKLEIVNEVPSNETIETIDEFEKLSAYQLQNLKNDMGLAMTTEDLKHIQAYYSKDEKRNPTETEIRVLDTYWSDHCRHTTFETILEDIQIEDGKYKKIFEENINEYLLSRNYVYGENAKDRSITLMDLATIAAKEQKRKGNLSDLEESDEINACSIYVDVNVNNKIEKWILQFKNETHNHPTEIEPFGGAATCIGGAIRDPLSGRTYVYQALRISGSANPNEKIEDTMKGKLPQKIITTKAAHGYSSYGNQIGLATTFVNEIYHSGYKAKRMELGVVVGAAPAENIRRDKPEKDDVVILLGGRTGRDGIGGATGSSKEHTEKSTEQCAAEVQKGNAITERKIQRLFRNKEVTRLIKKCNDFGAGGVSVAIGELADGLIIDLNKVPVKYIGLNGTELAISESQERMAVVIDKKDKDKFLEYADKENLEATEVAVITEEKRLVMVWNNNKIVDLSREFLDTNGAKSKINVTIDGYKNINNSSEFFERSDITADKLENKIEQNMATMNVASQRGLIEMFDSSIGSTTVLMPFGGKYQKTPSEVSIQKLPVMNGTTNTASIVAHGYNPNISSLSPYHGGLYAVIESMSKVVAAGGNYKNIRFTFQEYFERLGEDSKKWSKPLLALLGTNKVLKYFNLAAIGGKDSMSGTFNDISVPPTLVSFAVTTMSTEDVITTEFKSSGNNVYYIRCPKDELGLP